MLLDWKKNLGTFDRFIRAAIGFYLLGKVYIRAVTGLWATIAVIFAIFQFIEAALAY